MNCELCDKPLVHGWWCQACKLNASTAKRFADANSESNERAFAVIAVVLVLGTVFGLLATVFS